MVARDPAPERRQPPSAVAVGAASGIVYGLLARLLASYRPLGAVFVAMTLTYLFVMPFVIGRLAVAPLADPRWWQRVFLPWLPTIALVATAGAVCWEGSICIVMALPALLLFASLGGLLTGRRPRRSTTAALLVMPYALAPLEAQVPVPDQTREVATALRIAAPAAAVWEQIVEVPEIGRDELRPRFIHRIGFPRPLAATLEGRGVGAVRQATFAGGVRFVETIDEWREGEALRFAIDAQTESIPAVTLDPHVTIGGRYFDVLEGAYRIEPVAGGVVLHLTSRYRISTLFNFYAGPWSDFVMRSIQESILEVIRARSERAAAGLR